MSPNWGRLHRGVPNLFIGIAHQVHEGEQGEHARYLQNFRRGKKAIHSSSEYTQDHETGESSSLALPVARFISDVFLHRLSNDQHDSFELQEWGWHSLCRDHVRAWPTLLGNF